VPRTRLTAQALTPLPVVMPDTRETGSTVVHKDFAVRFDTNDYTVPPWAVGRQVVIKADAYTVYIYCKDKLSARHHRHYGKKTRCELPHHVEQVKKLQHKLWQDRQIGVFVSLGDPATTYLEALADRRLPIKKTVIKLLQFKHQYGAAALLQALSNAMEYNAFGAEYIENILSRQQPRQLPHARITVRHDVLADVCLQEPSLVEYDNLLIERNRHENGD
jgi:hypothetical protein